METPKVIEYKGKKYWLSWTGKYYYADKYQWQWKDARMKKALHRQVYEDDKWEIPEWHDIHHIDWNPYNNAPDNLEAVESSKHQRDHLKILFQNEEHRKRNKEILDSVRWLSKVWHASEEGNKWHSEHYKNSLALVPLHKKRCTFCNAVFETKRPKNSYFCSNNCFQKNAYKTRKYFEDRSCAICGKTFSVRKNEKTKCCSRECGSILSKNTRLWSWNW